MKGGHITVIKIGGSILRDAACYRAAARLAASEFEHGPTWVVLSAACGITDTLEEAIKTGDAEKFNLVLRRQESLTGLPVGEFLESELRAGADAARVGSRDRALAWGEIASVVAFQTYLGREGADVPIVELETCAPPSKQATALVPGFFVRDRAGNALCLPRGGSDISAMLVAIALGADKVRLWKKGGDIWSENGTLLSTDASLLLARVSTGTRPLHPTALRLSVLWGIDLVLEDPLRDLPATRVASRPTGMYRTSTGAAAWGARITNQEWETALIFGASGDA